MAHTWTPEIIKLVYGNSTLSSTLRRKLTLLSSLSSGFLLGLFMNPLCAMIALGSEDSVRQHRREVHQENLRMMEEAPPALITQAERAGRPVSAHVHG